MSTMCKIFCSSLYIDYLNYSSGLSWIQLLTPVYFFSLNSCKLSLLYAPPPPLNPLLFAIFSHTRFTLVPKSAMILLTQCLGLPFGNRSPSLFAEHTSTCPWNLNVDIPFTLSVFKLVLGSKKWVDNDMQNWFGPSASNLMEETDKTSPKQTGNFKFKIRSQGKIKSACQNLTCTTQIKKSFSEKVVALPVLLQSLKSQVGYVSSCNTQYLAPS